MGSVRVFLSKDWRKKVYVGYIFEGSAFWKLRFHENRVELSHEWLGIYSRVEIR